MSGWVALGLVAAIEAALLAYWYVEMRAAPDLNDVDDED